MERNLKADIGIVIAKDHEAGNFESALKSECGITIEHVHSGTAQLYLGQFEIHSPSSGKLKCFVTYMNDQGEGIKTFIQQFLSIVEVRYLTTVGVCGGRKEDLGKVMFFDEAFLMDKIPPQLFRPTTARYGDVEVWRRGGAIMMIAKPEFSHVILTYPHIVGTVAAVLEEFKETVKTIPGLVGTHVPCAVDMEIGYIFAQLQAYNYLAQRAGKMVETLHAIKAVSDTGDEKERAFNKAEAMSNAACALIAYLGTLLDKKLIVPATASPVVSAPAKGHSNATSTKQAQEYFGTKLIFDVQGAVTIGYKELAKKVGWIRIGQLADHMGADNEIASLLELIYKQQGNAGLKKIRDALASASEIQALEVIDNSPCASIFQ